MLLQTLTIMILGINTPIIEKEHTEAQLLCLEFRIDHKQELYNKYDCKNEKKIFFQPKHYLNIKN